MAELNVNPALLVDQGRRYTQQAKALSDALKEGIPLLESLGKKGLGYDEAGREFTVPYWIQQNQVLEVLNNMASVLAEVDQGLTILARRLPQADEDTADRFKRLLRQLETSPLVHPQTIKGPP